MSPINIELRKIQSLDITQNVMQWFADESLMRYYTNSKQTITRETLMQHIEEGEKNQNSFTYGIFEAENSKMIGTIKLGPINHTHKISDLVVLIGDKNYHGKGLAIEAIKLGNMLAFNNFGLRKLFGGMFVSNIHSIKAYLRAGWVVEGIRKWHYLNDGNPEDRIEVGCFNPAFFTDEEIKSATLLSLDELLIAIDK